jgi:hypothetical protein
MKKLPKKSIIQQKDVDIVNDMLYKQYIGRKNNKFRAPIES